MKCSKCGKEIRGRAQIQSIDKNLLCRECKMKEKKRRLREKIIQANYPRKEGKWGFGAGYSPY